MQEAKHGVWQFLRESEIYDQKGKMWKQREQEADAFYKKHWRHDLFSEESSKKTMKEWSTEVGLRKR